jgi:hypothetical protein
LDGSGATGLVSERFEEEEDDDDDDDDEAEAEAEAEEDAEGFFEAP